MRTLFQYEKFLHQKVVQEVFKSESWDNFIPKMHACSFPIDLLVWLKIGCLCIYSLLLSRATG